MGADHRRPSSGFSGNTIAKNAVLEANAHQVVLTDRQGCVTDLKAETAGPSLGRKYGQDRKQDQARLVHLKNPRIAAGENPSIAAGGVRLPCSEP